MASSTLDKPPSTSASSSSSSITANTGEISIASTHCVIYQLKAGKWVAMSPGWSLLHLYRDPSDETYRIVGWTVNDAAVVLNVNINAKCKFAMKSDDFHKLTDDEGSVFGLGFYAKRPSLEESKVFMNAVTEAIRIARSVLMESIQREHSVSVGRPRSPLQARLSPPPSIQTTSLKALPSRSPKSRSGGRSGSSKSPRDELARAISSGHVSQITKQIEERSSPQPRSPMPNDSNGLTNGIAHGASAPSPPPMSPPSETNGTYPQTHAQPEAPTSPAPPPLLSSVAPPASTQLQPSITTETAPPTTNGLAYPIAVRSATLPLSEDASSAAVTAAEPTMHRELTDETYKSARLPLGKLRILPPKPQRHLSNPQSVTEKTITDPFSIIHTTSVQYNPLTRQYKGLPPEWESQLSKQFGLAPEAVESIKLPQYRTRIPAVLVQMRQYLVEHGGLQMEGIFRVAPDAGESTYIKQQLNQNTFTGCEDTSIMANLIKVWYRELPIHILDNVDISKINAVETEDQANKVIHTIPEPYQSYLLWLIDLCVEVTKDADVNRMTSKNLGIVIGPNLFTASTKDPMSSLMYSQKVAHFLHKAIDGRAKFLKQQQAMASQSKTL